MEELQAKIMALKVAMDTLDGDDGGYSPEEKASAKAEILKLYQAALGEFENSNT